MIFAAERLLRRLASGDSRCKTVRISKSVKDVESSKLSKIIPSKAADACSSTLSSNVSCVTKWKTWIFSRVRTRSFSKVDFSTGLRRQMSWESRVWKGEVLGYKIPWVTTTIKRMPSATINEQEKIDDIIVGRRTLSLENELDRRSSNNPTTKSTYGSKSNRGRASKKGPSNAFACVIRRYNSVNFVTVSPSGFTSKARNPRPATATAAADIWK